uniref:Uncharacterized protein n=1 Tax=Oryza rufipogon TaxID=4529 RepID=A0A0E0RH25_ORYRU
MQSSVLEIGVSTKDWEHGRSDFVTRVRLIVYLSRRGDGGAAQGFISGGAVTGSSTPWLNGAWRRLSGGAHAGGRCRGGRSQHSGVGPRAARLGRGNGEACSKRAALTALLLVTMAELMVIAAGWRRGVEWGSAPMAGGGGGQL